MISFARLTGQRLGQFALMLAAIACGLVLFSLVAFGLSELSLRYPGASNAGAHGVGLIFDAVFTIGGLAVLALAMIVGFIFEHFFAIAGLGLLLLVLASIGAGR